MGPGSVMKAIRRMSPPHAGHSSGNSSPTRAISFAQAIRELTARLADVPEGERRDGPPQLVIRRKHPVVAMPVLPRRRDEIREPVEKLKR